MKKKAIEKMPLKVLYLEDSPQDMEITRELLINAGFDLEMDCSESEKEFVSFLHHGTYDIILSDFKLPGFDGFAALRWAMEICPAVPFICISGTIGEEAAVELIKMGAVDYVIKDRLKRLPVAIKRALNEAMEKKLRQQAEAALRESEEIFKQFMEHSPVYVFFKDENIRAMRLSKNFETMLGKPLDDLLGKNMEDLFPSALANKMVADDKKILNEEKEVVVDEELNGRHYTTIKFPIRIEGKQRYLAGYTIDITERKHKEEELRKERAFIKNITDTSPVGITRLDRDGNILFANQRAEQILGLSKNTIVGLGYNAPAFHITDLYGGDFPDEQLPFHQVKAHLKPVYDIQHAIKLPDGKRVILSINAVPLLDEHGRFDGMVASIEDITERKRAQDALRQSEEHYKMMFESAPLAINITRDTEIIYANPAYLQMFGLSNLDELKGYAPLELFAPEWRSQIAENIQRRAKGLPVPNSYEVECFRKDGTKFPIIMNLARMVFSDGPATVGFIMDITERKRAEEALQNKERYQRALLDNFPFAVWLKDTESRFLAVNQVFAKTFNIPSADELVGKTDIDIAERKIADEYIAHDRVVMQSRQKSSIEQEIIGLEKGKWYETYKAPVIGKNDELLGTVGFLRDITERKRTEAMLENERNMLRTLVDTLPYKIYIKDTESRFIICNKASAIRLGVSNPEEVIGKSDFDFLPYELAARFHADEQEVVKSGKSLIDHEEPIDQISGTTRWNLVTKVPIRDKQGNITGIVGSGRDITEQKQVERTLRENEQFFRLLFTTSPDAIILFDPFSNAVPWEIIDCNEVACRMNGYTREELMGKSVEMVNAKMTTLEEHEAYIKMLQNKGVVHYETLHRHRDGHTFPVEVATSLVTLGGRPLVLGIDRDITDRKQAENALRETTEFLENLFNFANAPIIVWDNTLRITKFNLAFERLTEYTMHDVLGKNPEMLVPADDRAFVRTLLSRALDGENLLSIEFPIQCKNGDVRLVLWNTANIYSTDGTTIIATIAHGQDITERKRAEEMQRESENRYRSVLQSATDAIVTADHKGTIVGWNSGAERIFGYSYTEAVGLSLTSLMPIFHRDGHTNGMERILSGGIHRVIGKTVELEGLRKDERVFPLELSLSTWETKSGIFFTGIIRDITERKQAAEELLKLSSAVEQSDSSIIITNVKGEIEYVNPKFVNLTGYSAQEVIRKNPRVLKSGHTSDDDYKILWKTISSGQVWRGEFQNKKKNGELYWESAIISPVRDSSGTISHFIAVKEDITQQRAMADQLRQMQRLEGLGTLAGGIAHDFNNILGIILAYTTSITRFKDDTEKLDTATEIIIKAVQRGTTLVQQILTFARKTETKFGPVDVNDVVMEIMSMILETFPKMLSYTQKFEKGIPRINADRSQLHQALLNLCVNARDAMPKGGVLNIGTRLVPGESLRHLHPDASASSYICIEVSDTGEGMSEEIRKRIFEPFFTTKGIGKGTGMGLAVVFGVVQSHKGFIDVESEVEKGTLFKLYLPASQVAEPMSEIGEETLEDISGGTEMLLIIEDEEMLLTSLRMVLEEKGYTVLSAGDGFSALKIYQEKKDDIALVLTDFGLPNISGLQVCEKIKQINPNEKIILATGYLDPEKKAEFLKTGVQHFLYKPYDLKKVLKEVRNVLDKT